MQYHFSRSTVVSDGPITLSAVDGYGAVISEKWHASTEVLNE
jgi:hypothetical protein